MSIHQDALCNNLFEELTTAFQKGDGAVCFRETIVWLVWFWENHHNSFFPRVVTKRDCGIEYLEELVQAGCKSPLEKLVVDATRARCRLIGGFCKHNCNLFLCDFGEVSNSEGGRVVRLDWGDPRSFCGEKPLGERLTHVMGYVGGAPSQGEDGGNLFD